MKKLSFLIILFVSFNCFASDNPEARVEAMITRVKQEKSMQPTLDFVHWETAFKELGAEEKKMFGVTSPDELKLKLSGFLRDPSLFIKQQLKIQLGAQNLPPEQMQMFESIMESQISGIKQQMDSEISRLINSQHVIHGSNIIGNLATVDVEFISPTATSRDNLNLHLVDDQWWISLKELQNKSSLGAGNALAK